MIHRLFSAAILLLAVGAMSCRDADIGLAETQRPPSREVGEGSEGGVGSDAGEGGEVMVATARNVAAPAALRVMTWNLEWFFDDQTGDNYSELAKQQSAPTRGAWNWKRDAVAQAIASVGPEVAGFQEVENRRVLFYLKRALLRDHNQDYAELAVEGADVFTEQDVGYIYRPQAGDLLLQPVQQTIFDQSTAMRASGRYEDVTKQLTVEFEVRRGDAVETLTIMNIHLRAGAEANVIRRGQARSVHAWLADKISAGENVIILGDFNTVTAIPAPAGSDLYAALGKETAAAADDLVDLHAFLPQNERSTHLQSGRALDRILVSPSLLSDDPDRVDLSFEKIERLRNLAVRGQVDAVSEHYDRYWQMNAAERDISDHWPVMATFQFK